MYIHADQTEIGRWPVIRNSIANRAQSVALMIAVLGGSVLLCLACGMILSNQWQAIVFGQELAISQTTAMRQQAAITLEKLNKSYLPLCNESNLRNLRQLVFDLRYVADIGVIDDEGRLACTTTGGVLQNFITGAEPDSILTSPRGDTTYTYYRTALMASKSGTRSTVVRMGRFNVAFFAYLIEDILQGGASAVQFVGPNGSVRPVVLQSGLDSASLKLLNDSAVAFVPLHKYDWASNVFLVSTPLESPHVVIQTAIPLSSFYRTYGHLLWFAAGMSALVGLLLFYLLKPRFLRWRELRFRIDSLLCEKNLLCMYQPIIDLATNKPVGCEVLMRLRDGTTTIYPDQALPAIVERNLTWKLDQAVLQVAVRELASAIPNLANFKLAFNFFPENIHFNAIHELISNAVRDNQCTGLIFNVEVLEQHYQTSMIAEISALKKTNYQISVDDFGTGYSNLGSVAAIAPHFLKIDKSFVFEMEDATVRSSLIPQIIGIGRSVGAKLIAEGIENLHQAEMLKNFGVEFGQGYFFSKPQPIHSFTSYLRSQGMEIPLDQPSDPKRPTQ